MEPLDIAIACDWDGDPGTLVTGLVEAGWLDQMPDGRLLVHGWHEHRPRFVVERERKRTTRGHVADSPHGRRESRGQYADSPHETAPERGQSADNGGQLRHSALHCTALPCVETGSEGRATSRACEPESENPGDGCDLPPLAPLDEPEEPLANVDALPVGDPWREVLTACRDIRAGHGRVLLASDQAAIKGMREVAGAGLRHEIPAAFEAFNASEDDFLKRNGWPVRVFAAQFSRWHAVAVAGRGGGPRRPRITSNGDGAQEVAF
jgi:hypothetical protein